MTLPNNPKKTFFRTIFNSILTKNIRLSQQLMGVIPNEPVQMNRIK